MPLQTKNLQKICDDLVAILQQKLPEQDPHLVSLIGQQYFMGTLSRLLSLSKWMEENQELPDLQRQDLHFSLTYPEEIDPAQVETIRHEAAMILAACFGALKDHFN